VALFSLVGWYSRTHQSLLFTHATGGSSRTLFGRDRADEDLDFLLSRGAIQAKAGQTLRLMQHLAARDPSLDPAPLEQFVRSTFIQLQKCWDARDYEPMRPLLMPDLFRSHAAQLAAMIRQHEINHIQGLEVLNVDFVQLRYTAQPERREFTALITAAAQDYYTDDRSGLFVRGDREKRAFQEFWVFHYLGGRWLLREIDQSRESDALRQNNFVEGMTDAQVVQIGGPGGPQVDAPSSDPTVTDRTSRVDALLQDLVRRDPMWDRSTMTSRVREVFLDLLLTEEAGDLSHVNPGDIMPATLTQLQASIHARISEGKAVEYRNLCVRKVDLVVVRPLPDRNNCEFMARVSAHAQTTVTQGQKVLQHDDYEKPFLKYLVFGSDNGQWKLKTILPASNAERIMANDD